MKIKDICTGEINIPLKTPFKTALRQVSAVNSVVVKVITDEGVCGYGEAPPTAVITGDTKGSVVTAVRDFIKPALLGADLVNFEEIMIKLHSCILKNTSAKAAVDMALYDLRGKLLGVPLYELLGGYRTQAETDITISLNKVDEMVADSLSAVKSGYGILKIKVGGEAKEDIERISKIREAIGTGVKLRIDANQGWSPKDAVRIITCLEDKGIGIELVEQPVNYMDLKGMQYVTSHVGTNILADECVFTPADAIKILETGAADMINIKLMKAGGIYNALKICAIAEIYGAPCMIGCMLESKLAVTAAAHLCCAKKIITMADLDGPGLCASDPYNGGPVFDNAIISMVPTAGLGIGEPDFIEFLG